MEAISTNSEKEKIIEFFKKAHEKKQLAWQETYTTEIDRIAVSLKYDPSMLAKAAYYIVNSALKGDLTKFQLLKDDDNEVIFTQNLEDNQKKLLKYCACLNKDNISYELIKNLFDTQINFDDLINTLQAAQLITISELDSRKYISIKENIQTYFFSIIEAAKKSELYKTLIQKASEIFRVRRYQIKQIVDDMLVVHIEKIITNAEEINIDSFELAELMVSLANYYRNSDKLSQAENYYNKVKNLLESIEKQIKVITLNVSIQDIYDAKLSQSSKDVLNKLIKPKEAVLLYAVEVLHGLGTIQILRIPSVILVEPAKEQERQSQLEEAIKILGISYLIQDYFIKDENSVPSYKPSDIFYTQRNLASAYLKQGELQKSGDLCKEQINDNRFQNNQEIISFILLDEGRRLKKIKDFDAAIKAFEESLKKIMNIPRELYSYNNKYKDMVDILAELGNTLYLTATAPTMVSQKEKLLHKAIFYLCMAEQALIAHYETFETRKMTKVYEHLALANQELGFCYLSEKLIGSAIRLQRDIYGDEHPYVKAALEIKEKFSKIAKSDTFHNIIIGSTPNELETKAQELVKKINDNGETILYLELAEVYLELENWNESEKNYQTFIDKKFQKKAPLQERENLIVNYGLSMIYSQQLELSELSDEKNVVAITTTLENCANKAIQYIQHFILNLSKTYLEGKDIEKDPKELVLLQKQHENLLNILFKLKAKNHLTFVSMKLNKVDQFKYWLLLYFTKKLQIYFFIKKKIDTTMDKTQFWIAFFKALANLLPQAEAGIPGVPLGKVTGANLAATANGILDLIEANHTSKKTTKINKIITRLGLDNIEQIAEAFELISKKIFSKDPTSFSGKFGQAYEEQINKLTEDSVRKLSKFCAYKLLNYLGSNNFNPIFTSNIAEINFKLTFDNLFPGLLITSESKILSTEDGKEWSAREMFQKVGVEAKDKFYILKKGCEHSVYGFAKRGLLVWESPKYEAPKNSKEEAEGDHKDEKSSCVIS